MGKISRGRGFFKGVGFGKGEGENKMMIVTILAAAAAAGVIQTVTGFGGAIFMMLFFPAYFPILNAAAVASSISLGVSGGNTWKYRKYINLKLLFLPAVFYVVASTVILACADYVPAGLLKRIFGAFLVALSLYFLFASSKIHLEANLFTAGICSVISGFAAGLFGISGPPMVLYFLAAIDDKKQYLGTIQSFFFLTGAYTTILRAFEGIYTVDMIPFTIAGLAAVTVGRIAGNHIVERIDADVMKKVIYVFLGLSGVLNLLS